MFKPFSCRYLILHSNISDILSENQKQSHLLISTINSIFIYILKNVVNFF